MESNYVSIYDISIGLIYLIILIAIANSRKNKILDVEIKKYYLQKHINQIDRKKSKKNV